MANEYNGPAEFAPLGAWAYFGWNLLFSIPIVGFILLIVFSCGAGGNINLRNYARSHFCSLILVGIFFLIIIFIAIISGVGIIDVFEDMANEISNIV